MHQENKNIPRKRNAAIRGAVVLKFLSLALGRKKASLVTGEQCLYSDMRRRRDDGSVKADVSQNRNAASRGAGCSKVLAAGAGTEENIQGIRRAASPHRHAQEARREIRRQQSRPGAERKGSTSGDRNTGQEEVTLTQYLGVRRLTR